MDFPQPNPPPNDHEPDIRHLLDAELTGLEYTVPRYLGPDFNGPNYAGAQSAGPGYTSPGYTGLLGSSPRPTSSRNAGSQPSGPEYSYVEYASAENTTQMPASCTHTGLSYTAMLEPSPPPTIPRNDGSQIAVPEHTGVQRASPLTTLLQNLEHAGPSYTRLPNSNPLATDPDNTVTSYTALLEPSPPPTSPRNAGSPQIAVPEHTGVQRASPLTTLLQNLEHAGPSYTRLPNFNPLTAGLRSTGPQPPGPEHSSLEHTEVQNTSTLTAGPGNPVFRPPGPEHSYLDYTGFQNTGPLLSGPGNANPQPANFQNEVSQVAPAPSASSQSSKPHDLNVWAGLWNSMPDLVPALDQVVGRRPGDPQPPETTTTAAVYIPMVEALVHRLGAVDLEAFGGGARGWEVALAEYTPSVDVPIQRVQDWIVLHCRIFFTSWLECEAVARACP
ncbi:hypothetical protein CDEST_12135 [Colletotrichum destructivum]|uniref:Uncharacterized protein n=1 Tax=Colletotrichum destructivum TaxID=34406 RepID=A0AAX4IV94_9PEZI|nr:hypothetical protein CDEST_12135 [Colletotrichum destructivum]